MKPFLENTNVNELEAIQEYMDIHKIKDPELLTERDYELIQESDKFLKGFESTMSISLNHMLKYKYQPSEQKRGWLITIRNGCSMIPSMKKSQLNKTSIEALYKEGLKDSTLKIDTGLNEKDFPDTAMEAFGTNRFEDFGNWEFLKNNFILKYARHDLKNEMEAYWTRYKW